MKLQSTLCVPDHGNRELRHTAITRGAAAALFIVGTALAGSGHGQSYPDRPIHMITGSPGGGQDFATRIIAEGISGPLGKPVVVDNYTREDPGEMAAKGHPDGYTLLVAGSAHWLQPFMRDKMPYDPVGDFAPITLAATLPNVLVVHPSVGANTVSELIALAKAKPGVLNYASGSLGSANHLAVELFKSMAGNINIVRIPYGGSAPAITALLGGEVQVMTPNAVAALPHVKSGKLRALGVTSLKPSALFPGLPTVAQTVPNYESVAIIAIFGIAKTPPAILNRLNQEIVRVLNQPEAKEKLLNVGAEVVGGTPEQLVAAVKSDMNLSGKLIKDLGIKAD